MMMMMEGIVFGILFASMDIASGISIPELKGTKDAPLMTGSRSIPWWAWVLVTLLGCVIIYFVIYAMCCNSESGEEVKCYLCCKHIGGYNWKNGSHRKGCSDKNTIFLNSLPTSDRVGCPKCGKHLRQWPKKLITPFKCDGGSKCPHAGQLLPNTGDNRFNCFTCNYDLCSDCIGRQRGATARRRNGWVERNGGHNVSSSEDDKTRLLGGRPRSLYLKGKLVPIIQKVKDEDPEEENENFLRSLGAEEEEEQVSNIIENPSYGLEESHRRWIGIASPSYSDVIGPPPLVLTSKESPPSEQRVFSRQPLASHLVILPSQSPRQTIL